MTCDLLAEVRLFVNNCLRGILAERTYIQSPEDVPTIIVTDMSGKCPTGNIGSFGDTLALRTFHLVCIHSANDNLNKTLTTNHKRVNQFYLFMSSSLCC